ncbi:glycosyltransferase family 4 protein [Thermodesulfobacteriota bacterium]
MDILFITQYFPPETGAAPERSMGFAKYLNRLGHRVQVVTSLPNHPASKVHPEYQGKRLIWEEIEGVSVLRTYVYANPKKRLHHRLLNFISFALSCLNALRFKKKFDVMVISIPPIFMTVSAFFMARLKRIPLILDIRDLWPQVAVALDEVGDNLPIRLIEMVMNLFYQKADQITVVTQGIRDALLKVGVDADKIHLITNGVDHEMFYPGSFEVARDVYKPIGCESKFIVLYTGVIGIIHGGWVIAETARILKDHNDIAFVVIGDGVKKTELHEMKSKDGLENLHILEHMQPSYLLPYIQGADLGLSTLQNKPFCEGTIPVKIFSYMACGLPVIFAGRGEGRRIIQEWGAGSCIEPENARALADAILDLKNDPQRRHFMGEKGVLAVSRRFSRQVLSEGFAGVVSKAVENQ